MRKVRITFRADGTVELDAQGFSGAGCQAFTAPFEAALGVDASRRELKAEFTQSDDETEENR